MAIIYVVWNEDRSEGVAFSDRRDAEEAAGIKRPSDGTCSTLSEFFRSNYADEDIFDSPEREFEIQVIDANN